MTSFLFMMKVMIFLLKMTRGNTINKIVVIGVIKTYVILRSVHLRESVNKRKIQFSFSKVSASAYERVSAYGNV